MGALNGCDTSKITAKKRPHTVLDEVVKDLADTLDVGDYAAPGISVGCDGHSATIYLHLVGGGRVVLSARLEDQAS